MSRGDKNIKDLYPLTYIQEGMLFHNIMAKDDGAYFIQYVLGCSKKLDRGRLSQALELLTLRYDILRTAFLYRNVKVPVQVVMKERKCELNEIDLSSSQDKDSELDKIKKADMERGFDLEKDPLLRVTVVNKGDGEYKLIWSIHHIIIDGWSNSILFSAFFKYYNRLAAGESKEQIKEEIAAALLSETSFGDYVKWIKKKDIHFAKEYFRKFLKNYDNLAAFNRSVYKNSAKKSWKMLRYKADDQVSEKIKRIVRTQEVTLNSVVETAVGMVIQKYCRLDDIVFGKVVSGREVPISNIDSMAGIFINTIPQRIKTEKNMTLRELLKNVQQQSNESSKYDYLGLSEINSLSNVSSDLIKILFVYENYYVSDSSKDDCEEAYQFDFEYDREQTNYDVTLSAYEDNGKDFYLEISYNEDLYDEFYAMGILKKIEWMLLMMADNMNQKVQDIELILEEEKQQILSSFNQTLLDYDYSKTVVDLFEEQAEKTSEHIAVVCGDEKLTYSELNKKVNRIAHGLRKAGIRNDDLVAVVTDKSVDMIVMLFGIIKSGAAYVPIDTAYPEDRIRYILDDCQPKAILVRETKLESDSWHIIDFNRLIEENDNEENPEKINKAEDLLYVIYTSGTTGKPKGVMLEHKGVVNLREYFCQSMQIRETDCILQFAKYTFDGSVWEITMALLNGAKLVICTEEERIDQDKFIALVRKEAVSVAALPPAFYSSLEGFSPRILITAGSEAIKEGVEKATEDAEYINSYGPTECTVAVTEWKYKKGDRIPDKIPIGKPICNTKVYIMDHNKLCGIGIPGEVLIAGRGVARGYLNQQELTNERFIKNPFGDGALYKTGDLARWLQDGSIDYMGRIDKQVKIRGFRIELAEIEEVLRTVDGVKDSAVIVKEDEIKEKYICAFVTSKRDHLSTEKIKEELSRKLPEYMLPSYIMIIDRIPVTDNGKLDIKALPEIELSNETQYIEPDNDTEQKICEAFAEVLGLDRIGVTSNFFDIGGHSLRAARLVNSIEAKTGVRIAVKAIFEEKTPRNIAAYILSLDGKSASDEIMPAEKKEYYLMSGVQKGLYFTEQMTDTKALYNMPQCFKLSGNVDEKRLADAYQKLVNRHEALRTGFGEKNGELIQRIYDYAAAELVTIHAEESSVSREYESFVRPFNLDTAPLMRLQLVKTDAVNYLFLDMHHIISDGMSMMIVMEELIKLYNGERLEELRIQYKDYSEWLSKRDISKQKEYWINKFKDNIPVLDMPLDYKRPAKQSFKGRAVTRRLGSKLTEEIRTLAGKTKTTEYMVVLSGLMIMLSKYSRQSDISVGTVISGRTNKEAEKIIGMFVNTLVMRAEPKENMTYKDFLLQVKEAALGAYENQEYPFEELVKAVCVKRDLSRNPLFDVMFAFQNNELFKSKMDDVEISARNDFDSNIAKFDLVFNMDRIDGEYELYLEYCIDLFKEDTIIRLYEHFRQVLMAIAEESECSLSDITMITQAEQEIIENTFNHTERIYPKDKTVAEVFEEQVLKTGNKLAVVFENERLTYFELNAKANCIANKLREAGIQNDDCVAVLAKKGVLTIVGILGIVKAGAAYVPIDSSYPKDRIEYLIADCKAKAVLVYNVGYSNEDKLIIDLNNTSLYDSGSETPVSLNSPEDLIYVIYTSGTTGVPKGVMIEHKSVLKLVKNAGYVPLNEETNVLQTGQMSFDASTFEVWGALLNGGTLHLAEQDKLVDNKELEKLIKNEKINTLWLTSTLFNQMFASNKNMFDGVKYLLIGGEKLSESHVRAFKQYNHETTLINGYGPTEGTTFTTTYTIPEDFDTIPIGKPISNTKVYIMNKKELCGIDVPGELCIAGDGLARGYLNYDELTKEKFAENPFGSGMLYKSGDLARWRNDGNIEYLGRIDKQVKIRGFRIEPAEVEAIIRKIDKIKDCTVIVREDKNSEKALHAYLCGDKDIDIADIRNQLEKTLPYYMIPSYMMQIDEIPVTRNGKLNERALPEILTEISSEYTAPSNQIEQIIADIYAEVLGAEQVSVHADFFNAGGNSLRVIRVINAIEEKTGVRLPVKTVFEEKTAARLAKCIVGYETLENSYIPKAKEQSVYPMSAAQKRLYMIELMTDVKTVYNIPMCLKLTGNVDESRIIKAYNALIKRHEALRTSFDIKDGELIQIISDNAVGNESRCSIRECDVRNEFEHFIRPFELKKAPLIRLQITKTESCYYLFLDIHHIISDGMSMNILVDEFIRLYNGEQLQELRIQYKDYSEWMKKRDLSRQKQYWISQFNEDIPVTDIPLDYERLGKQSFRGEAVRYELDEQLSLRIKQFAKETNTTEYMVLLSALMITLSKYSRKEDIAVGTPISGRTNKEMETIVGMFVNTLVMRAKPEASKRYTEFLEEVKLNALNAFENQEYPFDELVEEISVERDLSRNPLFDVVFALHNNENVSRKMDGVELEEKFDYSFNVSKFDITFNVSWGDNQYDIYLEYCMDLFKQESMVRMLKNYKQVLTSILSEPECRLGNIQMFSEEDKIRIVNEFNHTVTEYPKDKTVSELFEEWVCKTPDKIAVVYEGESVTYAQLNEKANSVAHRLRELGVGVGDYAAVISEKSVEIIVALVAIVKSGAAYVPIDPSYPKERMAYMLSDCKPKVVLTYNKLFSSSEYNVIELSDENLYTYDLHNPEKINSSNDLIYVIYTSGTTGNPKGVMIEHKGVVRLVRNTNYIQLNEDTMMLQTGQLSFDASAFEVWGALLNGGTLHLAHKDKLMDSAELERLIKDSKINTLLFISTLFNQTFMSNKDLFNNVDYLLVGGEKLSKNHIKAFKEHNKHTTLINAYGPTESSTITTAYTIPEDIGNIPIGKPISNTEVYIMYNDNLCAIGTPGELCIAGDGLARGYLNQNKLTEEQFINNPFGEGKLYKSGDLARWLEDGTIEYLGRIDEQVKIRGFRIELGEIESVICRLEEIKACAVIVQEDDRNEKAIYAYLVSDKLLDMNSIRHKLIKQLPQYMVPAYMGQIDLIPVTSNGKLDKRKLSSIKMSDAKEYTAPQNNKEAAICKAYSEVLNIDQVSITDTFFELGGDSIKAIRVISKLREYGYNARAREILNNTAVTELAEYIQEINEYICEQREVSGAVSSTPIMHYFDKLKLKRPEHFNQSMMLEIQNVNKEAVKKAVNEIVIHHDMLRAVKTEIGMFIRKTEDGRLYDYYEYDLSLVSKEEKEIYIAEKSNLVQASINLTSGPLVKVVLYEDKQKAYLQFIIHHLVVDGVSFRIIIEDFESAYMQAKREEKIKLPKKTEAYKEWSEKLKQYARSEKISTDKTYWDDVSIQLAKCRIEKQADGQTEYDFFKIEWDEKVTNKLVKEFIPRNNVSINDVLLTALAMAVNKVTNKEYIAIEMEGHGRENIIDNMMIDRTVGWFTSIYPVVLFINANTAENSAANIAYTKEVLSQIPSNGVTYNMIKYLTDTCYEEEIDISFNYLGSFNEGGAEKNISLSGISVGRTVSEDNHFGRPIALNGLIDHGRLKFDLQYDKGKYSSEFINKIAALYQQTLEEIISSDTNAVKLSDKKELPIVLQEEVKVYLHRSLPLCIILAYENYKEWYYSNYIHIFSQEDENGLTELNYMEPRDSYADIAEVICLGYHMFRDNEDFIDFARNKLDKGYYIIANVDEIELSNKYAYKQDHYIHSSIIYGYDDNKKLLKGIGFDESRLFTYLEFNYEEMQRAFISGKKHYPLGAPWCEWSAVQLIKPKTSDKKFMLDKRKFFRDLHDYIYSVKDEYRLYTFGYSKDKTEYGSNTYDVIIAKLKERQETGEFVIDYRAIHLMYEHKQGLYNRINYLKDQYGLSEAIKAENEKLYALIEEINKIRIKWFPIDYNEEFDADTAHAVIKELIGDITNLKMKEVPIVTRLYQLLKEQIDDEK